MDIIIYGSPVCVPCRSQKRYLDRLGVAYEYHDVTSEPEALQAIMDMGYTGIPVTVVKGKEHWQGFDHNRLDKYI